MEVLEPLEVPKSKRAVDLTGRKFGLRTVVSLAGRKGGKLHWNCVCECGKTTVTRVAILRRYSNCGCAIPRGSMLISHGMSRTRVYKLWRGMRDRCRNSRNGAWVHYGGRGISVCDRWDDFQNFFDDMGHPPSKSHSLDRIDVNGNYEPRNCRWATPIEQRNNRRVADRGEDSPISKLTDEQVLEIRRRCSAGESSVILGREFGVVPGTIRKIARGERWAHLLPSSQ